MALELCSENSSRAMSPRISFSHDLSQSDIVPVEQLLRSISSSSLDFNFCTNETSDQQPSMADELFSNGKILPTQIKKTATPPQIKPASSLPPPPPPHAHQENADDSKLPVPETEEKQSSKSFWGFKRSSSCGNGYARTLCPLPILSRSNSTGSSTSSKRSSSSKESLNHKQHSQKTLFSQKPPLKKTSYGSYGNTNNGIRVNPVLNVPSANMFGLGSIFSSGKDKNKKK